MFPDFLFTVITPSATVQAAGDVSFTFTHSSRLVPPKSTIASDGAAPHSPPGVTIFGSGFQTSVSSGFAVEGGCCPRAISVVAKRRKHERTMSLSRILVELYGKS
jgi:hypothetical protein